MALARLCLKNSTFNSVPVAAVRNSQLCLSTQSTERRRKKLLILGTGWGSYAVLKGVDRELYDVEVVSPRNHFLFTPLLASTTVGTLEFRSIIEPVRNVGFRQDTHFQLAHALSLDTKAGTLTCASVVRPDLRLMRQFDRLVIGVGALTNTFNVPGVSEHAFFLKEVWDARRIRTRILDNFELAQQIQSEEERKRLLHVVIVGGGPTGVEFGAELYDFFKQDVTRLYRQDQKLVRVTIVESHALLSAFDERLRKYAERKIKSRANFTLLQSSVTEVFADGVKLADGSTLPCGLVVWSTGLAPREFTKNLTFEKNKSGQIVTDQHLQVADAPAGRIFALGDCADIQDYPLPCTASVAERQGRYLAKLLNAMEKNGSNDVTAHDPFRFTSPGMLTYLGGFTALSQLPKHVTLQGVTSWLLWRSAYLTRLGSWRLRMQVPVDWTKTLLWGRDTSRIE